MPSEITPTKNAKKQRAHVVADSPLLKAPHRENLPDQEEIDRFRPVSQQDDCPKNFPPTENLGFESKFEKNFLGSEKKSENELDGLEELELHGSDQLAPHGLEELELHGSDQLAPHGFEPLNQLRLRKHKQQKLEGFLQD